MKRIALTVGLLVVAVASAAHVEAGTRAPGGMADVRTVRGTSMEPLIKEGSEVSVAPVEGRIALGDVVTARIGASETPVMKRVAGVPGDRLAVKAAGKGSFSILVNGKPAKNSQGVAYAIEERGRRMLSLYVKDYGGVIPPDAYLLLGDNPHGTRDSTEFGLVAGGDIVGKVVKVTEPAER